MPIMRGTWLPFAILALLTSPIAALAQSARGPAANVGGEKPRPKSKAEKANDERSQALLAAHNRERETEKLGPLTIDPKLTAAAMVQAQDMAEHSLMSHEGTDKSTFSERIERQGFKFRAAAENVAYAYRDVREVMKGWMDSPGHKANILGPYTRVGFGVARGRDGQLFWCADFADAWPEPPTPATERRDGSIVIDLLNTDRKAANLPPLKINPVLAGAATRQAKLRANADPNKPPEGPSADLGEDLKRAGYRYRTLAETAATGYPGPAEAAKGWLDAPDPANTVLGEFTEAGVGFATSPKGVPHWFLILSLPKR